MANKLGRIPLRDRVRELERIYGMVEREIAKELALMDVGNYQELRAVKTQERIDRLIRMLNRAAIKWSKKSIPMAYKKSYLISKTRLEILDVKRDKDFNVKKHRFSVMDYIDVTMDDLIKANQSIKVNVAMYVYLMRQASQGIMQIQAFGVEDEVAIENIISQAIERGERPGYATKLIREHFKAKTRDGQFILINGRNYNLRHYSKMVARTRMRQVQTEAVINTCEQHENDLVKVSDHNSVWDDICLEYEGKVFSISGRHPVYPLLDRRPPFHRNCKHNILPTSEEAIEVG